MRQYDAAEKEIFDKALADLCSSPLEVQKLKETAASLSNLPRARSSSSFQAELKASLLEKGENMSGAVEQQKKKPVLLASFYKFPKKFSSSSYFTAAAAVVVAIVALTAFYKPGLVKPGLEVRPLLDPPAALIARTEPEKQITSKDNFSSTGEGTYSSMPLENEPGKVETGESEITTPSPGADKAGEADPVPAATSTREQEPEKGGGVGQSVPPGSQTENNQGMQEDPLKLVPLFTVEKNLRSIKFAGKIHLPPVYYNTTGSEAALAVVPGEQVNCVWKPRKIVPSTVEEEARSIGTPAWASEVLSNEGFYVREGDLLVSNFQETQKGNFAEVFYSSQKSGESGLKLVLHYEEGKGILSYYYQEPGEIWQPGFYPLLSPSQAFARARGIEWYVPTANATRLDFSFQEVFLTYHDFLIEENSRQKIQRLPAYCFLGRETYHNGSEFQLYLPAVP